MNTQIPFLFRSIHSHQQTKEVLEQPKTNTRAEKSPIPKKKKKKGGDGAENIGGGLGLGD